MNMRIPKNLHQTLSMKIYKNKKITIMTVEDFISYIKYNFTNVLGDLLRCYGSETVVTEPADAAVSSRSSPQSRGPKTGF